MKKYFEKQFELRYFEMNEFGEASATTMLMLLEETAADHCYSIGYGLYDLIAQNVGWVLLSGVMQMDRYPKYKEKITIKTWLSSYSMIKGFRENIIYDEQGLVIGRSRGLWVFFDIQKRRPIRIFDAIKQAWSSDSTLSIEHSISGKIEVLDIATFSKNFKVNRFDTDMNEHVNNIRYLQWLMESLPKEIVDHYYLVKIEGRFITEALFDDTIISLTKGDVAHSFIHSIKIEGSSKVCATAQTFWKKR